MGNRITGPDDALKYAQGQTIKHPMGYDIKIDTPMDFMGVTDHSEYVGVTKEANTPGIGDQQDAGGAAPDPARARMTRRRSRKGLPLPLNLSSKRPDQGVHEPRGGRHDLEGKRQDRRREQPARQVHRVLLLRVDVDARQPQPAPQHLLPRLRQGPGDAVHRRWIPTTPRTCGSGWTHSARRATSCWRSPTTPMSATAGCIPIDVDSFGRPDRRRLGRVARPQRAPGRDQADQGAVGDPSPALAQRRVRELRDVQRPARPPAGLGPHRSHHGQLRAPGPEGRHHDAGRPRLQPVQVRHGGRLRLAQHRQPLSPGQLLRRTRRDRRNGRTASGRGHARQHPRRPHGEPRRPDRRLGRGEHARLALRRDVPQGNLRRQRPAHQGALLRRLGLRQGHRGRRRLGASVLRGRRPHGRRPAADASREGRGAERSSSGR